MAVFPRIQSPCPYKSRLAAVMDGDMCRMCERQVFDLSHWTDDERVAFLSACTDKVCVSYRLPLRPALAAAAMAAAAVALPGAAMAQAAPVAPVAAQEVAAPAIRDDPLVGVADPSGEVDYVFVGGINDPANVEYTENPADDALPALPVAYEDPPAPARPAGSARR
jgi:predicted Fe-S protein YdhL (DUF1289 family)